MPYYQLKSFLENQMLYEGNFPSFIACIEQAVKDRVPLNGIDLRRAILCNANLDDAIMHDAVLCGANLTGTNLSEAKMDGANFCGAALYNTCLCYADLSGCNFEDCHFGATDITGAMIKASRFSTLSCFTLDFTMAEDMSECVFCDSSGQICPISKPPVVIQGLLSQPLILMDRDMKYGSRLMPRPRITDFMEEQVFVSLEDQKSA